MFHVTEEGAMPKYGFNFYPLTDPSSKGFRVRIKNTIYQFRYSTHLKKLIIDKRSVSVHLNW